MENKINRNQNSKISLKLALINFNFEGKKKDYYA